MSHEEDQPPQIGPLQLRVMHAIWRHQVNTVFEVARLVNGEPGRQRLAYTTFLTVMRNLVRRGLLRQEKLGVGKAHRFFPLVDEATYKTALIRRILDDYCGGDAAVMWRYATGGEAPASAVTADG
jgi:predicted transcriptional regulator